MPSVAYAKFAAEILTLYTPPLRRKSTYFKMRTVVTEFGALPACKKTSDITPTLIAQWLDTCPHRAPMTHKSYLSAFRAACNYARYRGYLKSTPFDFRRDWIQVDVGDEDETIAPRHLSIAELDRFLSQLDAEALAGGWRERRLQALGYTYVHTGLRTKEALGLKVSDLLDSGVIRVRGRRKRQLKTRLSARLVGVPDDLQVVLDRWIPHCRCEWLFPGARRKGPWLHGSPGYRPLDAIKAAGRRAGIGHMTIQSLRRSIATHAKRLGIHRAEVQALLGHGSPTTQWWYLEEDVADAKDVARRITFRTARPPSSPSPLPHASAN